MEWEDIIEAREPVRNSAFNLTAFNTGDESIMGFVFVGVAGPLPTRRSTRVAR